MGKLKIIFSLATTIIAVLIISASLKFTEKLEPGEDKSPVFQVTAISENSNLFQDLSMATPLTVSDVEFSKNLRVKTDPQTSFKMLYKGTLLNVLPNSYIYYHIRREALSIISGEIYWEKSGKSPVKIYTKEDEDPLTISISGRLRKSPEGELSIWSYKSGGILQTNSEFINIPSGKYLVLDSKKNINYIQFQRLQHIFHRKRKLLI